jgi:hypothetical protein
MTFRCEITAQISDTLIFQDQKLSIVGIRYIQKNGRDQTGDGQVPHRTGRACIEEQIEERVAATFKLDYRF